MPKLKTNWTKMYWPITKGSQSAGHPSEGAPAGPPFTDRVQGREGSEKAPGGPEAGNNGGGCGRGTQETLVTRWDTGRVWADSGCWGVGGVYSKENEFGWGADNVGGICGLRGAILLRT